MTGGLLIAMVLRRFPDDHKPFLVVITQSERQQTFSKFIVALQGFQDTEGAKTATGDDSIMKATNKHLCEILLVEAKKVLLNIIVIKKNLICIYFQHTFTFATTKLVSSIDLVSW